MFHLCSSTWDPISQTKKRSMQKKQKIDVPRMRSQRVPSKKKNRCPAHVVPPGGPNLHKRNVRHQMERHTRDILVFFSRIDICLLLQDRTLSGTTYAGHPFFNFSRADLLSSASVDARWNNVRGSSGISASELIFFPLQDWDPVLGGSLGGPRRGVGRPWGVAGGPLGVLGNLKRLLKIFLNSIRKIP